MHYRITEWNKYHPENTVSFNAVAQALRSLPLTRNQFFQFLGIPRTRTTSARYWENNYNIADWNSRSDNEKFAATFVATRIVMDETSSPGFVPAKKAFLALYESLGKKVDEPVLLLAGYRYHHTASAMGYCSSNMVGTAHRYIGRFGEGFIIEAGRHRGSTMYKSIRYYIKAK